jgi:hypothetical protein
MSLINCYECQTQMSDRATSCPKCGCPATPALVGPTPVRVATTPTATKRKKIWSPIWATLLLPVMGYAGCQVLTGAVSSINTRYGEWPGLENMTSGEEITLLVMTFFCLGGPVAFWVFAHKMWGK